MSSYAPLHYIEPFLVQANYFAMLFIQLVYILYRLLFSSMFRIHHGFLGYMLKYEL
jgi:hypothetical protein